MLRAPQDSRDAEARMTGWLILLIGAPIVAAAVVIAADLIDEWCRKRCRRDVSERERNEALKRIQGGYGSGWRRR